MKYQVETYSGTVIDRGLSYEEATVYLEDPHYRRFCNVKPMKESDQNDCDLV